MGPKVLVVEDDTIVAWDISQMLELQGYQVIGITDSGRKAIELAKMHKPDIVLMDLRIKADLNGAETAVCIQGLFERPIPILFVTAHTIGDFPVIAAVNPYTVLAKPFSAEDLTKSLRNVVSIQID
jgi:two-component system, response regulator PdtaR